MTFWIAALNEWPQNTILLDVRASTGKAREAAERKREISRRDAAWRRWSAPTVWREALGEIDRAVAEWGEENSFQQLRQRVQAKTPGRGAAP